MKQISFISSKKNIIIVEKQFTFDEWLKTNA